MFGSKLRSWMETHIVRPRKKNNKHKQQQAEQAAAGGAGGSSSSSHGKKAGTLPAARDNLKSTTSPVLTSSGSHSIASPVRRREVSPIQCHTPSRYGWQSPDQETITSPKSDNLLYAPHRYQRHQTLPPLQTPPPPQQQQQLLSCSTDKSPLRVNCSSSSISSLSWSTGSKEPSSAAAKVSSSYTKVEHIESSCEYRAPVEDEVDYEEVGMLLVRPPAPLQDYQLVYEPEPEPEPEPEQARQSASNHVHYGRLLPSKLAPESVVVNQGNLSMGGGNRGMGRPGRGLPQRGNFLPGPRPHSLSSPESAYSTGYSTDGTSPCAVVASSSNPPQAAAPEYYINMRSGTHYFPSRSVNSLAIEAQRYKFGLNRIEEMSPMDPLPKSNFGHTLEPSPSPLAMQRSVSGAAKLFESPSPRQRPRIRTNPWYSTLLPGSRMELDATSTTSTTSSGIKSGNELEGHGGMSTTIAVTPAGGAECSEASSSSTEVENLPAPHTMRRRHEERHEEPPQQQQAQQSQQTQLISDDEATLNEMIGKFDESYIYEKETDILSSSDSDATNCNSELDTGQDAGDECDTDELLDIDFIDTSSMHEVMLEQRNLGSCQYYPNPSPMILRRASTRASTRSSTRRRCAQQQEQSTVPPVSAPDSGQRRRKRFLKTRKKSCENREKCVSASPLREPRGTRSVGGTPVCLRRQLLGPKERIYKTSPLSNRSNSLIFGSVQEPQFMTIAESEKALLKADLEADMKYKQLIMEAESLLESLKNSLQSIPRDTPVASPRRLNPLANKRVEMLKHGATVESNKKPPAPASPAPPLEHELAAAINRRIELLKFETSASPPNSPKPGRCCSPRKTHLTNFMNQNAPPELPPRKQPPTAAPPPLKAPLSPQLQLNGRRLPGTPRSPRRCLPLGSDSELEEQAAQQQQQLQQQPAPQLLQPGGNQDFYCPHSEPLKRKVYKGSSSFERIKKTFDLELDMNERPKSIGNCSNGGGGGGNRQQSKLVSSVSAKSSMQDVTLEGASSAKQQLIVSTIVDLKRSLEHQSYELSGLTEE